jgi:sterol desaturase/sphingolipid hydroxylase (fatty acid hydroxylase superfamily)
MQQVSKNQKISKTAAKTAIRIFIIILFMGILPLVSGQNQPWDQRLADAHLVITNKWTLVFPAVLFLGFLSLTILCMKNKYSQPDVNWLLVLNAVILITYLVMLYSRIYKVLLA